MSMACHRPKNVTPSENQGEGNQMSISMQANFPAGHIPSGSPEGEVAQQPRNELVVEVIPGCVVDTFHS